MARIAVKKELKKFWSELLPTLQKQPDSSKLHDVARLDYEVSNLIVPSSLEDAEQKVAHFSSFYFVFFSYYVLKHKITFFFFG